MAFTKNGMIHAEQCEFPFNRLYTKVTFSQNRMIHAKQCELSRFFSGLVLFEVSNWLLKISFTADVIGKIFTIFKTLENGGTHIARVHYHI